ncbi:MAG TPA: cytochrome c-type biogenesis protein CcmH [Thiotrichales bacterium]|nr:cytochrome c-type biogenesis protein CcmH [Thiotrichales bacterium]
MKPVFLLLVIFFSAYLHAAPVETFQFDSKETEQAFHRLSEELRCLVCQNQNIAESNADLAKDLRLEIYNMLSAGKTEDEIVDFMVQRYGDYVLYRPPLKPLTWLLWFGPALLFALALVFVIKIIRAQPQKEIETLSDEDRERINSLHAGKSEINERKEK